MAHLSWATPSGKPGGERESLILPRGGGGGMRVGVEVSLPKLVSAHAFVSYEIVFYALFFFPFNRVYLASQRHFSFLLQVRYTPHTGEGHSTHRWWVGGVRIKNKYQQAASSKVNFCQIKTGQSVSVSSSSPTPRTSIPFFNIIDHFTSPPTPPPPSSAPAKAAAEGTLSPGRAISRGSRKNTL